MDHYAATHHRKFRPNNATHVLRKFIHFTDENESFSTFNFFNPPDAKLMKLGKTHYFRELKVVKISHHPHVTSVFEHLSCLHMYVCARIRFTIIIY